ncbi:MAG: ferrous iron transport protein B [Chloroflexi bacterium]|nr:ferrous iron transport protein B [Chloroflexota bacterium]
MQTLPTPLTIALAGNPNVGKSSIFNALTGANQHVGNWPGKTIDKQQGRLSIQGREIEIVDLPGTYSLAAYSVEEIIARDFIVNEKPHAVVTVLDATNLERNLYLAAQMLELNLPLVIALNMADEAEKQGIEIDTRRLSAALGGVPVVQTIGSRAIGIDDLKESIYKLAASPQAPVIPKLNYGPEVETELRALEAHISAIRPLGGMYNPDWLALKLLEGDEELFSRLSDEGNAALVALAKAAIARVEELTGEDPELLITDARYGFIAGVLEQAVVRESTLLETVSDRIDKLVMHRIWGLPIFLMLMWVVFQVTANVSAPFLDYVDYAFSGPVSTWASAVIGLIGLGGTWFESLVVDGMIAGVGGVLVFVPVLMFLFAAIAVLEDSGYMARAAFVMDRVMRLMGLHGKSFLPMLVGFGCTVPAIYATRTLKNEDDRKLTAFLVPFMSCGARLPVYVMFGAIFFGAASGNLVFAMYILGILIAVGTGIVMKHTLYKSKPPQPFVMELPPYRMPSVRTVWRQVWEQTSSFLRNAATLILLISMVVWLLMAVPARADAGTFTDVDPEHSLFGTASGMIAPVFAPAGFGTWEASGSLITGLVAKEVVISTMSQIYVAEYAEEAAEPTTFVEDASGLVLGFGEAAVLTVQEVVNIVPRTLNLLPGLSIPEANFLGAAADDEDTSALGQVLLGTFTPLAAVAFCVFVLLYVPCMAAVAAMRQEFGTRWMILQAGYALLIAWGAAVIVYQVGTLIGLG